jgi:ribonuclease I
MVTLQILGGRKEKIRPGDVLGALTNDEGGPAYTREQIGKIQVTEFCTFVAVHGLWPSRPVPSSMPARSRARVCAPRRTRCFALPRCSPRKQSSRSRPR